MSHSKHSGDETDASPLIRPMREADLSQARLVRRLAFGTFLGMDSPESFGGDSDTITTRWRANPDQAFVAAKGDEILGSVLVTNWGSVGFFGPLTVHPDHWDRGVGTRLLEPVVDLFDRWQTKHAGLFTFSDSLKHIGLYQKFGFWPRHLTMLMSRRIGASRRSTEATRYSDLPQAERPYWLLECRTLTDSVHQGLDVTGEIDSVVNQSLGDTILLWDRGQSRLAGMAVCHVGPGTEAGSGTCYVKFAAVRPGPSAGERLGKLLDECEVLASLRGASLLLAGVNTGRVEAYRLMLSRSFRSVSSGVAMHRPNEPGSCRQDIFLIDDWR